MSPLNLRVTTAPPIRTAFFVDAPYSRRYLAPPRHETVFVSADASATCCFYVERGGHQKVIDAVADGTSC
jgi:hypothetical protein